MPPRERHFDVRLHGRIIGRLLVRDDFTSFAFTEEYVDDPQRAVLGLGFEDDLLARHQSNMRLPPWFSNLLPEGRLREWIAEQRGVAIEREMELLAEIGHDLPGAVSITVGSSPSSPAAATHDVAERPSRAAAKRRWTFSLAGVQLKFSMLARGDRLTLPASGDHGDWIVKLPDANHRDVPHNEHAMMTLARRAGIDVPECRLVHRDLLEGLPDRAWPNEEAYALAVRRFDRGPERQPIHIEDFAQVRLWYPDRKYDGTYESAANLAYRGRDTTSLREFVRRLAFITLIRNDDAHLKNWSLIYQDPRSPTLAPAYDLLSTAPYAESGGELALRLAGTKRFESVTLQSFRALGERLGADGGRLEEEAASTIRAAWEAWRDVRMEWLDASWLGRAIDETLLESARSIGIR